MNTPGKNQLETSFLDKNQQGTPNPQPQTNTGQPVVWDQFEYKQFGNAPKITLSGLSMCVMAPLLVVTHILIARFMQIPRIQYGFVTFLVAFIFNYTAIIRKYQLRPYLAQPVYDNKLKYMCFLAIVGMVMTLIWGWNGSSGMIFACYWEYSRGNKMGTFGYIFLLIGVGSLLMEEYFGWQKLLEFIPGLIFGYIASVLFTMRQSPTYTIAHQYVFLTAMILPMFFPASRLVVPNLFQWLTMIITGFSLLFTVVILIKLMQSERVSIVVASISGIIMVGTSHYAAGFIDLIGAIMIVSGLIWMIKKQYIDVRF